MKVKVAKYKMELTYQLNLKYLSFLMVTFAPAKAAA